MVNLIQLNYFTLHGVFLISVRRGENRPDFPPALHNYLYFHKVDIKFFQILMATFSMRFAAELRSAGEIKQQRTGVCGSASSLPALGTCETELLHVVAIGVLCSQ